MATQSNINNDDPTLVSQAELEKLFVPLEQEIINPNPVPQHPLSVPNDDATIPPSGYKRCPTCARFFIAGSQHHCSDACLILYRRCLCCQKAFMPQGQNHLYCSKTCTSNYILKQLFDSNKKSTNYRYIEYTKRK